MEKQIICLSGLSSCGKSYITSHYFKPQGYTVHSLATPIYEILSFISGKSVGELHCLKKLPERVLYGKDARELLCTIGQGFRESIHPDIWVHQCLKNINTDTEEYCRYKFVIDDIRDVNEYNTIKYYNPNIKLIFVYREDNNPYLSSNSLVQERESHYDELKEMSDLVFNNTIPSNYLYKPEEFYMQTLHQEIKSWLQ